MPESAVAAGTGNTAPTLTTVTVLVFLWALVAYFIRLYVKLSQSDGWKPDDWAITGAIVGALAQLIATCYAVHRGCGMPWQGMAEADRLAIEKSLYASQILYIVSIGAAKISASFFIAGVLARDTKNIMVSRTLTGLCVAFTVGSIVAIAVRGDLLQPWETHNRSQELFIRWVGIEAAGFILDVIAAAVTAYFVYDLQMKTVKKLTVFAILNCRLLLAVPVAFRLYFLHPSITGRTSTTAETIRQVIIGSNIMFAALSCLKPFLKPFDAAAFGSHQASRNGMFGNITAPNKNSTYYELSANNATNRSMGGSNSGNSKGMIMHSQRSITDAEDDEIPLTDNAAAPRLRPGHVGHTTDIRHGSLAGEGVDSYGRNISKTQTWTVSTG